MPSDTQQMDKKKGTKHKSKIYGKFYIEFYRAKTHK